MSIKTRLARLEASAKQVIDPAELAAMTPEQRYLRMLDGPVAKPKPGGKAESLTPEECYRRMIGQ